MAFWALDDVRKGGDAASDVFLLPVAVKYTFVRDMTRPIESSIARLEKTLAIEPPSSRSEDRYPRLRAIGIRILETLEAEYGVKAAKNALDDLSPRMNAMRNILLQRCAQSIGISLRQEMTQPEQMRALINAVYAVSRDEYEGLPSPYRDRLHRQQMDRARSLGRDLERVATWIAVHDNYVRPDPSDERMADNLRRLEVEAFGKTLLSGLRNAEVRVGEPISLAASFDAYKTDRKSAVSSLTTTLECAVKSLLLK